MAESVVTFLLKQLSTLIQKEYAHLGGLEREVKYLEDELGSMRAVLHKAEAKEICHDLDSEVQEWAKQVREVAYDTEDVLDEFLFRFGRHRAGGFYGRVQKIYTSIKNLRARHKISTQIKNIKNRIEHISARHQRYRPENITAERASSNTPAGEDAAFDIRGHALLLEEADLVGIHKPKHELISHILDDESRLKVVSVVGMGGLGKTTLAKRVYEDGNVKRKFSTHAWVPFSQRLQIKEVCKNLIKQFYSEIKEQVPPTVESMDVDSLRLFVKEFLEEKTFIIVLDDVWAIHSWEAIKYALPDRNRGSRVILTTRIADVASASSKESHGHVYKMKPLSVEESWNLFCKKAFEDSCCPPHLEQVSRNILSKCDGLPLAIVAIGGFLALKDSRTVDEWQRVLCSLGGELEGTGKLDRIKKILLLSYNDLPCYLKICLLYTSIFPEDSQIWAFHLVQQWIAEGFVQETRGMTSVEVAMGYLKELVSRSLIQVLETFEDGSLKLCSIHDLLHEVILSKSKEHNITTVVAGRSTEWPNNARRLAIHDFVEMEREGFVSKHLRSLVVYRYTNPLSSSSLAKLLCGGAKLIKVLHLEGAGLKNIPKEVFKLFHLKYLNLNHNPITVIPRSIGKLRNLEFLRIDHTNVMELPFDILKLGKLQELHAFHQGDYSKNYEFRGIEAPYEIGQLVSLQILGSINADNEKVVREIGKITQLRTVSITRLRSKDGKELCSSIEQLANLRDLWVASVNENEILDLQHSITPIPRFLQKLILRGPLEKIPPWIPSLRGLTELYLFGSKLMEDPIESLQELPNLTNLTVLDAYQGETLCFKAGGFQKLEKICLQDLTRLTWIRAEEGTMPNLHHLEITNCTSVGELPQGIQNLSKLQYLGLYNMSNGFLTKLQNKESEAHRSIAHITEVQIARWVDGKWEKTHSVVRGNWVIINNDL